MPVPPGSAVLPERIEAVVLDVGETLVDETRAWSLLADAAGLTRLTLFAALGALIERGEDHRKVWDLLTTSRPEIVCPIEEGDFYPDALDCIRRLSGAGYRVGLAGNQPVEAETALAGLGLPVSFVASSARWGVEKPSPGFFRRVAAEANRPPEHIAYVGDRLDNDVLPARAAGMWAVFLRRGPWGHLHGSRPEASWADARIDALSELLPAPPRADRTCVHPLIVGVHGLWTACRLRVPCPLVSSSPWPGTSLASRPRRVRVARWSERRCRVHSRCRKPCGGRPVPVSILSTYIGTTHPSRCTAPGHPVPRTGRARRASQVVAKRTLKPGPQRHAAQPAGDWSTH